PDERLKRNLALPNSTARAQRAAAIELAVRLWAMRDEEAAKAVRHIDRVRLRYYANLYGEMGLAPLEARKRAFLFYAALLAKAYIVAETEAGVASDLADM